MTTGKAIGIGCGIIALMGLLSVGVFVLFFHHVSKDLEGVDVDVSGPMEVVVGDTFDLKVSVANTRAKKTLSLSDIDIANEYLAGFLVVAVEPKQKSSRHVPIDNSQSYTFDVKIPAGETKVFIFTLRAVKEGVYRGDIDVCEGLQFVTKQAQTVVQEK